LLVVLVDAQLINPDGNNSIHLAKVTQCIVQVPGDHELRTITQNCTSSVGAPPSIGYGIVLRRRVLKADRSESTDDWLRSPTGFYLNYAYLWSLEVFAQGRVPKLVSSHTSRGA